MAFCSDLDKIKAEIAPFTKTPDQLLLEFFTFYRYEFNPHSQMIDLSRRKSKPVIPRECSEMLFHYTCKPKN